jgi:hypothetical protein
MPREQETVTFSQRPREPENSHFFIGHVNQKTVTFSHWSRRFLLSSERGGLDFFVLTAAKFFGL